MTSIRFEEFIREWIESGGEGIVPLSPPTSHNGEIAIANEWQQLMAENQHRKKWFVKNLSTNAEILEIGYADADENIHVLDTVIPNESVGEDIKSSSMFKYTLYIRSSVAGVPYLAHEVSRQPE